MLKRAEFLSLPVQHGRLKHSIRAHRHLSEVIKAICLWPIKLRQWLQEWILSFLIWQFCISAVCIICGYWFYLPYHDPWNTATHYYTAIQLLQYNLIRLQMCMHIDCCSFNIMLPCNDFLGEAFKHFCVKHFS